MVCAGSLMWVRVRWRCLLGVTASPEPDTGPILALMDGLVHVVSEAVRGADEAGLVRGSLHLGFHNSR